MRTFLYLSNARLPSEKANALQSMQQCEALGQRVRLEFWYPRRNNPLHTADIFDYYGVRRSFQLRELPSIDAIWLRRRFPRAAFLLQTFTFQMACVVRLATRRGHLIVYSRNPLDVFIAPLVRLLRPSAAIFLEDHDGLLRRAVTLKRALLRAVDGTVVTTSHHAAALVANGVRSDQVLVAPNGVKPERFEAGPRRPSPGRIIYMGNLFRWKGVYVLVEALQHLPARYTLEVVGGSPELAPEFARFVHEQGLAARVSCLGPLPPSSIPARLRSAAVAILPNSARSELSARFTSPLKLFEYMAAGVPIVASDVPAITEVVTHDRNGWLVPADDPAALAAGIRRVCEDETLARRLVDAARLDVARFTWVARAEAILRFVSARSGLGLPVEQPRCS